MHYRSHRGGTLHADAVEAATKLILCRNRPSNADVARQIGATDDEFADVFADNQQLIDAVLESAVVRLHDQCVRSLVKAAPNDPLAQFTAIAEAYLEWAHDNPGEYAILGDIPADLAPQSGDMLRYESSMHELMLRILAQAQSTGLLDPALDPFLLIATMRSFAYGLASKMLNGNLSRWTGTPSGIEAARASLQLFLGKALAPPHPKPVQLSNISD